MVVCNNRLCKLWQFLRGDPALRHLLQLEVVEGRRSLRAAVVFSMRAHVISSKTTHGLTCAMCDWPCHACSSRAVRLHACILIVAPMCCTRAFVHGAPESFTLRVSV
eukprot:6597736-Alexandrium_andersonii.AAC.1